MGTRRGEVQASESGPVFLAIKGSDVITLTPSPGVDTDKNCVGGHWNRSLKRLELKQALVLAGTQDKYEFERRKLFPFGFTLNCRLSWRRGPSCQDCLILSLSSPTPFPSAFPSPSTQNTFCHTRGKTSQEFLGEGGRMMPGRGEEADLQLLVNEVSSGLCLCTWGGGSRFVPGA